MPIVIQELVITAVVDPEDRAGGPPGALTKESRERLIESCAAETLRILREKRER